MDTVYRMTPLFLKRSSRRRSSSVSHTKIFLQLSCVASAVVCSKALDFASEGHISSNFVAKVPANFLVPFTLKQISGLWPLLSAIPLWKRS